MSTLYNRTKSAIVIHHMGDGLPPEVSILRRWNPHNYEYPEYDFGIEADGTIRAGRPLTVQGAHCISDKPPYSQKGGQWWNQNSIGIGLAGDFTKYPMPKAQFLALVGLIKELMSKYSLTLDNVYPHGQVTYTSCPGCTYSKVPALKGSWSYDEFEQAVNTASVVNNSKGETKLKKVVVYFSSDDYSIALDVANILGGVAMFCRNRSASVHPDAISAEKVYTIGGPKLGHPNEVYMSGNTALDTVAEVVKNYVGGKLA